MKRFTFLALCFSAACLGQTSVKTLSLPGSGDTTTSWGTGDVTLGAAPMSSSTIITSSGTGTLVWANNPEFQSAETRKPLRPGVTLAQVKYSAKPVVQSRLAPRTYLKLASLVGLISPATDEARMLDYIFESGTKVYDFALVDKYLYNKALKEGTQVRWVWKPLREKDRSAIGNSRDSRTAGLMFPKQYGHAVPERVLAHVAGILEKLPDAVFLVSDYEVIKPDPFLAITTEKLLGEGKIWIVDVWAEPGFTDAVVTAAEPAVLAIASAKR